MADIVLTTLNARFSHSSLGLRYLLANLGALRPQATLREYVLQQDPMVIAEDILARQPRIIGIGVYIWNVEACTRLVALLKTLRPDITIVLGGPEVSYEQDEQAICRMADYVIAGQGDLMFAELCEQILSGTAPAQGVIQAPAPPLHELQLPYSEYSEQDIAQRVIYVEASRGCPFRCEFCLSALDKTAYPFDLEAFLNAMEALYQRGARRFKFVDRTFNLKVENSLRIMEFFLQRMNDELFVHFELIPDHLPAKLREAIRRFPPGSLQFEIGVQSLNPEVQARISRKQDSQKSEENLRWLRQNTHAHIHADLIIGLPGEDEAGFARGFDHLYQWQPHEIQVGILKRLRGSTIIRHSARYGMCYQPYPPYAVLQTNALDFATLQKLRRFARYWELIANSGRFKHTLPLLLGDNPYQGFKAMSHWLYEHSGQTHRIGLDRLFKLLHQGMLNMGIEEPVAIQALEKDFLRSHLKSIPGLFIRKRNTSGNDKTVQRPRRQQQHLR